MKTRILNLLLPFCFIMILSFPATAQRKQGSDQERKERMEKIESARTAFITDKINLTPEQAQKFWPVYNEYNAQRKELRHKGRVFRGDNIETMSDKDLKAGIENMFEHRQAELNLEKSYAEKFQQIISVRQLAQLYKAEREFTKVLLKRLDSRHASKK